MNKYIKILLKAGILLSFSSLSQIAPASSVQVVGSFNDLTASDYFFFNRTYNQDNDSNPVKELPNNLMTSTDSVSYFGWGLDKRESYQNHQLIQSHFWFNGTGSIDGSSTTTISDSEAFSLGVFTYTNEETILSGGMVEIDFQMDITFDGLDLLPVEYRIGIDNTYNADNPSADTATLLTYPDNIAFTMDNTEYLLTFNGFSRDGGVTFETYASLPEDQQTTAEIFATLTTVPIPAAVWLFGSGLLSLIGVARHKKA